MQTELASAQSSLVSAQRSLDSAQSSLSSKQSRLSNTSSDGSKYSLSKEISSIKSKISSLNSQISLLKGKISSLQDQIKQIDETIAQLQSTISETRSFMENLIQTMQEIDRACEANMIANNEAIQDYINKLKKISDSVGGAWGVNDNPLMGIDPSGLATGNYQTASKIANSSESTAAMMAAKAAINDANYKTATKIANTSTSTAAREAAKAAIQTATAAAVSPKQKPVTLYVPSVTFGNKASLGERTVTLPGEWVEHINYMCDSLNVDYHLATAFIVHESGGDPNLINKDIYPDNPIDQATGLFQFIPRWHDSYKEGGQYYNNNPDVFKYAIEKGADINDLRDPLGNITVSIAMLHENYKGTNGDMQMVVGKQGVGYDKPDTYEILYYRDYLAKQDGKSAWYTEDWYIEKGKQ